MSKIDKYLFTGILSLSLGSGILLAFIFAFFKFLDELKEVGNANYNSLEALQHVAFLLPTIFSSLISISILIGVVVFIGGMNSNRELIVPQSAGLGLKKIILKALKFSIFLSVICIVIIELISPASYQIANNIKNQALGKNLSNDDNLTWLKDSNTFILLGPKFGEDSFEHMMVFDVDDDIKLKNFISAENSKLIDQSLVSTHARDVKINHINRFANTSVKIRDITIPIKKNQVTSLNVDEKSMYIHEIIEMVYVSISSQINEKKYLFELISRVVKPLNLTGMLILVLPIIVNFSRVSTLGKKIFIAVSIGIFANLLDRFAFMLSMTFETLTYIAQFLPSLLMILLGLIIHKKKFI